MSHVLTRMFGLFTLVSYLVVGTAAVRFVTSENTDVYFSTSYFSVFSPAKIAAVEPVEIMAPEMHFAEIEIPKAKSAPARTITAPAIVKVAAAPEVKLEEVKLQKNELPFHEPVQLKKIEFNGTLASNLIALYRDVPVEEKLLMAEVEAPAAVKDEISTKMAKTESVPSEDAEPMFYDYPAEETVVQPEAPAEIASSASNEIQKHVVEKIVDNSPEEVAIDDLVAFDYSAAQKDIAKQVIPAVSNVTIQEQTQAAPSKASKPNRGKSDTHRPAPKPEPKPEPTPDPIPNALISGYPHDLTIQTVGTNLNKTEGLNGFSVQFQDDLSEAVEDYGDGQAVMSGSLARPAMTRSVKVVKLGFASTYTDLVIEEGSHGISLPLMDSETFNDLIAPYEAEGPVGMVLVEMDDESEAAALDVPAREIIHLDGDLKQTSEGNFRYQLFVGVKAGNALLSYQDFKGQSVSKIIHVHDRELTFEANYYEPEQKEIFSLFEEGLLSKERAPLIIGASQVRRFASAVTSRKIGDHTYKVNFERALLGGRRYLELTHLDEPVFIGARDNKKISVPTENFMRYVVSQIDGGRLGNHCVVQVNLARPAAQVAVGSESVEETLMTYTQALDTDGRFYDTAGEKTQKIIVVGESQGSGKISPDGKINVKITYEDGTVQYLGTYCSPNTYLVEQL